MKGFFQHRLWAITDDEGSLIDVVEGSVEEAERKAKRGYIGEVWIDALDDEDVPEQKRFVANEVVRLPIAPEKSMKASTLPQYSRDDVELMSLHEAHARLVPFFPKERVTKDGRHLPIYTWQKPNTMSQSLLSSNYKLSKIPVSRGLNMLPHAMGFWLSGRSKKPSLNPTVCLFSNEFCRQTCLVYSGQNLVDDFALGVKLAKTEALLSEPLAFSRMLLAAIAWHEKNIRLHHKIVYVRLNLLSDIPWELFLPGVMEAFPRVQFYDYTKVPARWDLPENYDLTFSFSGTNLPHVEAEAKAGRRIATVFFNESKKQQKLSGLPVSWLGMPVVNGDKHDLRPKDPGGVVVGLMYKTPMAQIKSIRRAGPPPRFVVACFEVDGQVVTTETPRQANAADYEDAAD